MASLNKVQLIGRLGQDPDLRFTTGGTAVCNISLATTDSFKDKAGNTVECTEWHKVVMFGRIAEVAGDHLKKGAQVYIEGRNKTERWKDKTGADRYTTKVEADVMKMLDKAPREPQPSGAQPHDNLPY